MLEAQQILENETSLLEMTFSTNRRKPWLADAELASLVVSQLELGHRENRFCVSAYVVMPTHCHLLVSLSGSCETAGEVLRYVKLHSSCSIFEARPELKLECKRTRRNRPEEHHFWLPGRGDIRPIWQGSAVLAAVDYIHMNPVKAGLCLEAEQYLWSSARQYVDPESGWITAFQ